MNNEEIKLLKQHYSIKPEFPNRIYYICEICGKELYRFKSQISTDSKSHHYCCKEHYALGLKIQVKGENNPNWNHRWNEAQRKHQSEVVTENFKNNPELRYKCGATNRGKTKDTCEHLKRAAEKRKEGIASGRIIIKGHSVSEERKIQIGIEHKAFMNDPKTKAYYRKWREEKGDWIPLSEKTDYEIYYKCANWIASMFNKANTEETLLLKENGIFNQYTNTKGCVRDHMYSRKSGFKNRVFPELLRHPCNCQIITHSENVSKAQKGKQYQDTNSQTLEELFRKIEQYTGDWIEQELCLKLIQDYNNGKRWKNPYKNSIDK